MTSFAFRCDAASADALDAEDELASFSQEFEIPHRGHELLTYLCGHSLGLMPRAARAGVDAELDRWGERAVEGHFGGDDGWLRYHERFAAPLAALVGAHPDEVIAMNTLTVNLHLMLVSFYRPTSDRYKILIERDAFPSDRFAVESHLRLHGYDPLEALVELAPEEGEWRLDMDRLAALLEAEGDRLSLVLLPGVQYLSGQALDLEAVTALAQHYECRVGFDLAHTVGNIPVELHASGADFAVWCSYKYLNSGPGAIAGAFVHRKWHGLPLPRFEGWWGQAEAQRFVPSSSFSPMPGAAGWQLSNPPILSLAPLAASLEVFRRAGMSGLRAKSVRLTAYLEYLLREELGAKATILTPNEPDARGCQLSIKLAVGHDAGRAVADGLRDAGVVADWRDPGILRLAPVPLYNRFRDAFDAVRALKQTLA